MEFDYNKYSFLYSGSTWQSERTSKDAQKEALDRVRRRLLEDPIGIFFYTDTPDSRNLIRFGRLKGFEMKQYEKRPDPIPFPVEVNSKIMTDVLIEDFRFTTAPLTTMRVAAPAVIYMFNMRETFETYKIPYSPLAVNNFFSLEYFEKCHLRVLKSILDTYDGFSSKKIPMIDPHITAVEKRIEHDGILNARFAQAEKELREADAYIKQNHVHRFIRRVFTIVPKEWSEPSPLIISIDEMAGCVVVDLEHKSTHTEPNINQCLEYLRKRFDAGYKVVDL